MHLEREKQNMISKKTVFILGAGASSEFKYPLGEKLREYIINNLEVKNAAVNEIAMVLAEDKFDVPDYESEIIEFAKKLKHDGSYSIDNFLERFKAKYLLIGKLAIAQILSKYEDTSIFFSNDNWYRHLHNIMKKDVASLDEYAQNQVSFVTFNYDRSLEYFLYTALISFHENANENTVTSVLNKIPIIHLYGKIDPLPFEPNMSNNGRPYGKGYTLSQFKSYKENIYIIFENIPGLLSKNFLQAHELMKNAERIYFLGFGFHPQNLDRLLPKNLDRKIFVQGTSLGVPDETKSAFFEKINRKQPINGVIDDNAQLINTTIYEFLTKNAKLD